jgi:Ser/Thr protein kinase RdoA (MazF antagonist)
MGWEALGHWGEDAARIGPLAGGVANDIWSVHVHGHLAVGRLGSRSDADLAWETELLQHLDREGLTVPVPIPTTDGRLFADGLVVMRYVEGRSPETAADWRRVADTLRRLHQLTQGEVVRNSSDLNGPQLPFVRKNEFRETIWRVFWLRRPCASGLALGTKKGQQLLC